MLLINPTSCLHSWQHNFPSRLPCVGRSPSDGLICRKLNRPSLQADRPLQNQWFLLLYSRTGSYVIALLFQLISRNLTRIHFLQDLIQEFISQFIWFHTCMNVVSSMPAMSTCSYNKAIVSKTSDKALFWKLCCICRFPLWIKIV